MRHSDDGVVRLTGVELKRPDGSAVDINIAKARRFESAALSDEQAASLPSGRSVPAGA